MLPYIYSDSWEVTHNRSTMMRALVMDFRDDPKVFSIADQFMFGPAIMVNPVTKAGATSRSVYLPAGCKWIDFWTGKTYAGGQTIEAAARLQTIPLFVRGGSIIPFAPPMQSAMEKDDPIELRVYPGADGSFNFYEDQGDGYEYEKGGYATIPLIWDDAAQSLTIGQRVGSFAGMEKNRAFRVVRVSDGIGVGAAPVETNYVEVDYSGMVGETVQFSKFPATSTQFKTSSSAH